MALLCQLRLLMSFVTGHDGNAGDAGVVLIYAKLFVSLWEEQGGEQQQGGRDHKCIVRLMG